MNAPTHNMIPLISIIRKKLSLDSQGESANSTVTMMAMPAQSTLANVLMMVS